MELDLSNEISSVSGDRHNEMRDDEDNKEAGDNVNEDNNEDNGNQVPQEEPVNAETTD